MFGIADYGKSLFFRLNLLKIGSVSTHLDGNNEQVWQSIKFAWESAKNSSEVSMVLTLSNTTTH